MLVSRKAAGGRELYRIFNSVVAGNAEAALSALHVHLSPRYRAANRCEPAKNAGRQATAFRFHAVNACISPCCRQPRRIALRVVEMNEAEVEPGLRVRVTPSAIFRPKRGKNPC
jgi:hypothetical protein